MLKISIATDIKDMSMSKWGKRYSIEYEFHYENKLTKNIRPTDILQIYTTLWRKFTKYLVNVLKFTKYLVNFYHQKGVKHYVLTNWNQITPI